jgi:hypothetical protein
MSFFSENPGKILAAVVAALGGGIPIGIELNKDSENSEFAPLAVIITCICGAMGWGIAQLAFDFSANPGESFAYNMEKFAPAANGTTGFLLISFIVILLLGNIMINTCPNFIEGEVSNKPAESDGFVAWVQTNYPTMSWSIAIVPIIIITIITFLPLKDKQFKILIVSVILIGLTIAALMFNSIKKIIFGKKDSFTNVKEEFGDMVEDKKHPFKIAVGTQNYEGFPTPQRVYYRLNNDYEGHKTDNNEYQEIGTTTFGANTINVNYESYNNQLQINLDRNENQGADIYMSEVPWGKGTAKTLKKITTDTITEPIDAPNKTFYLHSFETGTIVVTTNSTVKAVSTGDVVITTTGSINSIATVKIDEVVLKQSDKILLSGQNTDKTQNGVYKVDKVNANTVEISKDTTQPSVVKVTEGTKENKENYFSTSDDGKTWTKIDNTKIVLWEGLKGGNLTKNGGRCKSIVLTDGKEGFLPSSKYPLGIVLTVNNVSKSLEVKDGQKENVKSSIKTSYTIYYVVVWISILVYTIFQKLKGIEIGVTLEEIVPFIIAALLETLLVAQSHASFEVSEASDNKDNVFRFALAAYVTRVITVSGFFSTIINHVEN